MRLCLTLCIFLFPALVFSSPYTSLNRYLQNRSSEVHKNIQRLSSGIQLLTDDPAYTAIYEKMDSQLRALDQTINAHQDMILYYRFEEALLADLTENLQRIRELALQAGNSLYGDLEKEILKSEMRQNYEQIFYILRTARFNNQVLFSAILDNSLVQSRLEDPVYYQLQHIDGLLTYLLQRRAVLSSWVRRLESRIKSDSVQKENVAAAQSHGDTDFGEESSEFKRNQILLMANVLMLHPRSK